MDYPNQDLPGSPLHGVPSAAACEAVCLGTAACDTYVFIAAECPQGSGDARCYLKSGTPPSRAQLPCYCGGQVARPAPPPQPPAPGPTLFTLSAGALTASLGARGLVGLALAGGPALAVGSDGWSVLVDGALLNSSALPDPVATQDGGAVTYVYAGVAGAGAATYTVIVTYTLPVIGGGGFVRKALALASSTPADALQVALAAPWDALYLALPAPLAGALYPTGALGTYGVFLRAADGTGVAVAAENPFLLPTAAPAFAPQGALLSVGYAPSLTWNQTTQYDATPQPFAADAGLLALYTLSPNAVPPATETDAGTRRYGATRPYLRRARPAAAAAAVEATDTLTGMLFEHEAFGRAGAALPAGVHAQRGGAPAPASWLNYAERDVFRAMGEAAFAAAHGGALPEPLRVQIPWTLNDYQIDVANATQWPEYQRILEMLGKMGVERILYAGTNSDVANVSASAYETQSAPSACAPRSHPASHSHARAQPPTQARTTGTGRRCCGWRWGSRSARGSGRPGTPLRPAWPSSLPPPPTTASLPSPTSTPFWASRRGAPTPPGWPPTTTTTTLCSPLVSSRTTLLR